MLEALPYMWNIRIVPMNAILAMKLGVMLRRSKFRDYYDVYSILRNGGDIDTGINSALQYS